VRPWGKEQLVPPAIKASSSLVGFVLPGVCTSGWWARSSTDHGGFSFVPVLAFAVGLKELFDLFLRICFVVIRY